MHHQQLLDRCRQIIKVSKQHRHFSMILLEYTTEVPSDNRVPFMLSKRQNRRRFIHSEKTFDKVSRLSDEHLSQLSNYLTLKNLGVHADYTTSLTEVPTAVKNLRVCDITKVLEERSDGEDIFRSLLECSLEADRSLRVSPFHK